MKNSINIGFALIFLIMGASLQAQLEQMEYFEDLCLSELDTSLLAELGIRSIYIRKIRGIEGEETNVIKIQKASKYARWQLNERGQLIKKLESKSKMEHWDNFLEGKGSTSYTYYPSGLLKKEKKISVVEPILFAMDFAEEVDTYPKEIEKENYEKEYFYSATGQKIKEKGELLGEGGGIYELYWDSLGRLEKESWQYLNENDIYEHGGTDEEINYHYKNRTDTSYFRYAQRIVRKEYDPEDKTDTLPDTLYSVWNTKGQLLESREERSYAKRYEEGTVERITKQRYQYDRSGKLLNYYEENQNPEGLLVYLNLNYKEGRPKYIEGIVPVWRDGEPRNYRKVGRTKKKIEYIYDDRGLLIKKIMWEYEWNKRTEWLIRYD